MAQSQESALGSTLGRISWRKTGVHFSGKCSQPYRGASPVAYDVFISYSSKDKHVADAVCVALEQHGIRCWLAPRDIVDLVIVVDDASHDDTVAIARTLPGVQVETHPLNRGYGGNQKTCYRLALAAGADIVIMIHPDYQYTPQLVPALASLVASGLYPCMLASRILGGRALRADRSQPAQRRTPRRPVGPRQRRLDLPAGRFAHHEVAANRRSADGPLFPGSGGAV